MKLGRDEHDAGHGRSALRARLVMDTQAGRWQTTWFLGALRASAFNAPFTFEGVINGGRVEEHLYTV